MRKDTKDTADLEEPIEVDDLEAPDADEADLEDLAEADLLDDDDEDELGDVALVDDARRRRRRRGRGRGRCRRSRVDIVPIETEDEDEDELDDDDVEASLDVILKERLVVVDDEEDEEEEAPDSEERGEGSLRVLAQAAGRVRLPVLFPREEPDPARRQEAPPLSRLRVRRRGCRRACGSVVSWLSNVSSATSCWTASFYAPLGAAVVAVEEMPRLAEHYERLERQLNAAGLDRPLRRRTSRAAPVGHGRRPLGSALGQAGAADCRSYSPGEQSAAERCSRATGDPSARRVLPGFGRGAKDRSWLRCEQRHRTRRRSPEDATCRFPLMTPLPHRRSSSAWPRLLRASSRPSAGTSRRHGDAGPCSTGSPS